MVPIQLSSDIPESSSAQQAAQVPGESGPFHSLCPSVALYQEVNKNVVFFWKLVMAGRPEEPQASCG